MGINDWYRFWPLSLVAGFLGRKTTRHTKIVQILVDRISVEAEWSTAFEKAVHDAIEQAPVYMEKYGISTLEDYFNYMDNLHTWIPTENSTATQLLERVRIFYFLFNQKGIRHLQTSISPETTRGPLSWLSKWLVSYAQSLGEFLDTPESLTAETLSSFHASSLYGLDDYIVPEGGWKSFNHFFARHVKPERRPIADPDDSSVITSPADCMLWGNWPVDDDGVVTFKGISWKISDLLQDSVYGSHFRGGEFSHSILFPYDYHRMHTPVAGKVLECKVIRGQVMLEAIAVDGRPRSNPDADEGYQWCQTRGLIVLESAIGKVAILPIGMGHISSVTMTPKVGDELAKGSEIGYFQFGGSDIIMVFQGASKVDIPMHDDKKIRYKMGQRMGTARLCN